MFKALRVQTLLSEKQSTRINTSCIAIRTVLKKHTHTLWSFYESTDCIFFSLGPTETSVECYKWIFYMCLEGRIFHYNSSLTCIAAFYSSLLPNIAHGEFFKSLGFSHILNSSYLCSINFLKRLLFLFYIMVCNQRIEVCFKANKPTLSWVCNLLTYVNPYMEAIIIIPYTKAILVILSPINSKSVKKESAKTSWKCRGTELNSTEQADHNICGLHQWGMPLWGSSLLSNSMEKLTF